MKSVAKIRTEKAERYMKALVNHFSRKITASYEGNVGIISFPFGSSELVADGSSLILYAESKNEGNLNRVEQVVESHLARFTQDENLALTWSILDQEIA